MVDSLFGRRSSCATGPRQEGLGYGTYEGTRVLDDTLALSL
jgi:hypothetical protein